jgi:hypothetical protein
MQEQTPEAFRQAFQALMAENPEITYDSIQAIEKKGADALLTLEVSEDTDKGEIEQQFLDNYEELRLKEAKSTALLEEKDSQIQTLTQFVTSLIERKPDKIEINN